jgi:hypothetical protein
VDIDGAKEIPHWVRTTYLEFEVIIPDQPREMMQVRLNVNFILLIFFSIKNVIRPNFKWKFDSKHSKLEQKMFLFLKFIYAFIISRQKPLTNTKKESKQQRRQVLKRQKMLRHLASSRAIFRFHLKEYFIILNNMNKYIGQIKGKLKFT